MVSLPKCGIIALPLRSSAEAWTVSAAAVVGGGRGDVLGGGGDAGRTT